MGKSTRGSLCLFCPLAFSGRDRYVQNVGYTTLRWWKERIDALTKQGLSGEAYALYMEFTFDGCEL